MNPHRTLDSVDVLPFECTNLLGGVMASLSGIAVLVMGSRIIDYCPRPLYQNSEQVFKWNCIAGGTVVFAANSRNGKHWLVDRVGFGCRSCSIIKYIMIKWKPSTVYEFTRRYFVRSPQPSDSLVY